MSSRPDRFRRRIHGTLQLLEDYEKRADLAEGAARLRDLLDEQADYLARLEKKAMERRYDPSQPFIGLLFGVPSLYGAYLLWELDAWGWRTAAVLLGLFGVLFAFVGIQGFFTPPRTPKSEVPKPTP